MRIRQRIEMRFRFLTFEAVYRSITREVAPHKQQIDIIDRAAVAGISASNPFPPLPGEFTGKEIRLQFTFQYNIKSR